jgi:hypothetical protein
MKPFRPASAIGQCRLHDPLRYVFRQLRLIKLGAPRYQAILTGLSRKGYWHLANTLSTNRGLGKEFLQRQGLTSMRSLWIGIHYPAKAR